MRWLAFAVVVFVSLGMWIACAVQIIAARQAEYNWAVQGRDAAIEGCPGRYSQHAEIDGHRYLIGCWGQR